MDDAFTWWLPFRRKTQPEQPPNASATARFGGDGGDEPVLIGVVHGPVESAMAQDALAEAQIPAHIKHNALGAIYGISVGSFGAAEVWVPPTFVEQARDVLIGIGLLDAEDVEDDT